MQRMRIELEHEEQLSHEKQLIAQKKAERAAAAQNLSMEIFNQHQQNKSLDCLKNSEQSGIIFFFNFLLK